VFSFHVITCDRYSVSGNGVYVLSCLGMLDVRSADGKYMLFSTQLTDSRVTT